MSDYCVVITDGAHARFFTLEPVDFPELESGPRLVEHEELLNPEKEIHERDLFTDSKTGRGRAPLKGPAHGYDDHRSQHENEFERRFARRILEKTRRFVKAHQARHVVLTAPAHMLGSLRLDLDILFKDGIRVHEFKKDMTKFWPRQIHSHLAKEQVLPAWTRLGIEAVKTKW